jgi:hypothetical protein
MTLASILTFGTCAIALVVATLIVQREHPAATVMALFDHMMDDHVVRIAVIVVWWWLGWHFLAGQTT